MPSLEFPTGPDRLTQTLQCAKLAALAYDTEDEVRQALPQADQLHVFNRVGVSGFIAKSGNLVVIAIAGTNGKEDVPRNMNLMPVKHGPKHWRVTGHGGFVDGAYHIAAELAQSNIDLLDKKIWIIGHSLGGGIGTNVPMALAYTNLFDSPQNTIIVTFGAPRSIKCDSTYKYDREGMLQCHQYAHVDDVVPASPLRTSWLGNWCHPGTTWWLSPQTHPVCWRLVLKPWMWIGWLIAAIYKCFMPIPPAAENGELYLTRSEPSYIWSACKKLLRLAAVYVTRFPVGGHAYAKLALYNDIAKHHLMRYYIPWFENLVAHNRIPSDTTLY